MNGGRISRAGTRTGDHCTSEGSQLPEQAPLDLIRPCGWSCRIALTLRPPCGTPYDKSFAVTPDLRAYAVLLTALLSRRLSPDEFQAVLVPLFKGDQLMRPPEIYDLLNRVFLAAEAYQPVSEIAGDCAVTGEELYAIADEVRSQLEEVVRAG